MMLDDTQVVQGELTAGLREGGPLLLPYLVKGAVKAVRLLCSKVRDRSGDDDDRHQW